jgi:hypothetical protein
LPEGDGRRGIQRLLETGRGRSIRWMKLRKLSGGTLDIVYR